MSLSSTVSVYFLQQDCAIHCSAYDVNLDTSNAVCSCLPKVNGSSSNLDHVTSLDLPLDLSLHSRTKKTCLDDELSAHDRSLLKLSQSAIKPR